MFETATKNELMRLSNEELVGLVLSLQSTNATLKHELFGKKSEKRTVDPEGMQPLFDEIEVVSDEPEFEEEAPESKKNLKPRKRGGIRKPLPKDLPRDRVEHDLSDEEKTCATHGTPLVRIGEKSREELQIIPATIKVIEHVTFSYKCPCCSKENDKTDIVTSEKEPTPIAKSFASATLLAYIVVAKFQDSLPLYRLAKIFARYGILLSRTLMAGWMIKMSELVIPLINLMWDDTLERKAVGCDETPVQVLKEPDRKPEQTSYMWVTATMDGPPIVLFNYETGRSAKVASKLLSGFEGVIVCDGLKSYDSFARAHASFIVLAGCMAHIRRKFVIAEKAIKRADPKSTPATKIPLDIISKLYQIEKEILNESPEARLKKRQENSRPLMDELKGWLDEKSAKVLPKSLIGKAISYALDQWDKMQIFLENPLVEIDNNRCERYIRQFVIGRNNWVFSTSQKGATASARLYSLVESAKANGLEPFSYFSTIFKELPKAKTVFDYERLLPHNVKDHFEIKPLIKAN